MAVAFSVALPLVPATGSNTGASGGISTAATLPGVIVGIALASATAVVNSLTITGFGGTASEITNLRDATNGSYISVWQIVAPTPSTNGTVQGNFSASVPWQMCISMFSGCNQSNMSSAVDAVSAINATTPDTLTALNLTASDVCFGVEANVLIQNLNAITPNAIDTNNNTAINAGQGYNTGTGGVTFGTNTGPAVYSKLAIRVMPPGESGGGGGGGPPVVLMGQTWM